MALVFIRLSMLEDIDSLIQQLTWCFLCLFYHKIWCWRPSCHTLELRPAIFIRFYNHGGRSKGRHCRPCCIKRALKYIIKNKTLYKYFVTRVVFIRVSRSNLFCPDCATRLSLEIHSHRASFYAIRSKSKTNRSHLRFPALWVSGM